MGDVLKLAHSREGHHHQWNHFRFKKIRILIIIKQPGFITAEYTRQKVKRKTMRRSKPNVNENICRSINKGFEVST